MEKYSGFPIQGLKRFAKTHIKAGLIMDPGLDLSLIFRHPIQRHPQRKRADDPEQQQRRRAVQQPLPQPLNAAPNPHAYITTTSY